jgi:beta-lactam-binding protein with PASTA domain
MVQGKKHVERIPEDWVDSVRPRVVRGRKFKEAVAEIFAANAQLLALERNSQRVPKMEKVRKPRPKG